MWWINLVRKVQWKWKSSWRLQKMCRELRLMIQLGGKKMRRAIRGAQAGLRRFARFQMWLIRKKDLKRRGLFVPADLSSMEEVETDELVEEYGDDLYVITMGALPKHSQCLGAHQGKKLEDSSSKSIYNLPGYMSHNSPLRYRSTRQASARIDIDASGPSSCQNNYHTLPKSKADKSRRHGRRSRFNDKDSFSEFMEEETSQRSAFLDFLFEDSPSPSRFLTAQALQNILGCPTCREIVSILPSDISPSRGCRPCEQCQGYLQTGKCLLCECSYGETKSLLLEKLTMSSWLRSCRYQSYGCQSLVGIGVDIEHNEDECKFKPLHCPFMLCRRKFPAASLIKHLQSEHRLHPHDGPKCEGNIFCLSSNKGHRGARANYTLDPCAVSCFGHIFILRILRHSTSWYIWVWAFRIAEDMSQRGEEIMETFPFTIRFQQSATRSLSESSPVDLTLTGFTVPLRLSMEEIMERGLCRVIPEQGSLFDCPEENGNSLAVDFALVVHPATTASNPRPKMRSHPKRASRVKSF